MSPLSVRMPFVLLLAFLPFLLLLVFDPLPLLVLLFTLPLCSRFLPPGGFLRLILLSVSCSAGWPASILSSSSSSLFLLFSCGFRFVFSFVGACLVYFIACALMFSLGGGGGGGSVPFHKCLSTFCPPLFSDASRDFSSGSSAFSPLFVRLPLLSLFLRCLQLLLLFLRWLRPPPLASLHLSLCLLLSLLPRGSLSLRSPFLRCLNWVGGCMRWVLHRCCLRLLQVFLLSPLPCHFSLCLLLQFLLPLFLLPSLRVSQGSILLPLLSCLRLP